MRIGLTKFRGWVSARRKQIIIALSIAAIVGVSCRYLYVTFPAPWKQDESASYESSFTARFECYSHKSFFGSPRRWTRFSVIRHSGLGDYETFTCIFNHPEGRRDWSIQWSGDNSTVTFHSGDTTLRFAVPPSAS